MTKKNLAFNVLMAASGTGGHIFPALAVAEQLKKLEPNLNIYFVGTPHGLENTLIPKSGFPLLHLNVGRLNSNVSKLERIKTFFQIPVSILRSVFWMLKYKPQFVVGFGGHASGPLLLAAYLTGVRSIIWEPNSYPGLANRILSKFVDECYVVFDDAKKYLCGRNHLQMGLPIRSSITKNLPQPESASTNLSVGSFSVAPKLKVLIVGGSQGARGMNKVIQETLLKFPDWQKNFSWVHQTGPLDFKDSIEFYKKNNLDVEVHDFLHDMPERYAWADFVVSRSGTGTISEIAACGKPSLFIPLPTAADDHQTKNAQVLVNAGAAYLIDQRKFSAQQFCASLDEMRMDPEKRRSMGQKAKSFYQPDAAKNMALHLLKRDLL